EGAIKHCENFLPGSSFAVSPNVLQGRSDIEGHDDGCIEGHDAVKVLRAQRLDPVLYALSNEGFSHGFLLRAPEPEHHDAIPVLGVRRREQSVCQTTAGNDRRPVSSSQAVGTRRTEKCVRVASTQSGHSPRSLRSSSRVMTHANATM